MARVVIADDDPDIRALISIAVNRAGLELVATADDGLAALAAVAQFAPDLAVLDVSMPGLSGLEICRLVRADDALAGVRIVLLSAAVDEHSQLAGLDAGAEAYVEKPFSPRVLAARLATMMEIVR